MSVHGNDVIGLKVITKDGGEKVENIDDILYDPREHRVIGLLVKAKGMFSDAQVIPIEDVQNIGPDAVMVASASVLKKSSELGESTARIAQSEDYLTTTEVLTEDGKKLGRVVDLIFEPGTGQVEAFECSEGGLKTLQSGRKLFTPEDIVTVGKDATIVRSYTESAFQAQAEEGGLQGVWNEAKDRAGNAADSAKERGQQAAQSAHGFATSDATRSSINDAQSSLEAAAFTAKDKLQDLAEQARAKFEEARHDPGNRQRMAAGSERVEEATDSVKEKFSEVKDQATAKGREMQEQAAKSKTEDAVGQYITKNILAPDDTLLAARGDVVTHELLAQAATFDLTDQVLQNVTQEPITSTVANV
jgi:uncharacterized protein YrrD